MERKLGFRPEVGFLISERSRLMRPSKEEAGELNSAVGVDAVWFLYV